MRQIANPEDIAIDLAAQASDQASTVAPVLIAVIALVISVVSVWVNLRASAPRLTVRFDPERIPHNGIFYFKITNEGRNWVTKIKIKWAFDPLGVYANQGVWSHTQLMPGESFTATLGQLNVSGNGDEEMDVQEHLGVYEALIFNNDKSKRHYGTARYQRQIRIPFTWTWQRVSFPTSHGPHTDEYNKLIRANKERAAAQQPAS